MTICTEKLFLEREQEKKWGKCLLQSGLVNLRISVVLMGLTISGRSRKIRISVRYQLAARNFAVIW